jgi:5'-deoxynucleotidase YfbR-like HD superfamily hydrolase
MIAPSYLNGQLMDLTDLRPEDVDVKDIADTLAKINRFNGRTLYPYSVAQHAVLVSTLIMKEYTHVFPEKTLLYLGYEALHHDDTEAYTGDIIKSVKPNLVWAPGGIAEAGTFEAFSSFEADIRRPIADALGLARTEPDLVKECDKWACEIEQVLVQGWKDKYVGRGIPEWAKDEVLERDWQTASVMFQSAHREFRARKVGLDQHVG